MAYATPMQAHSFLRQGMGDHTDSLALLRHRELDTAVHVGVGADTGMLPFFIQQFSLACEPRPELVRVTTCTSGGTCTWEVVADT